MTFGLALVTGTPGPGALPRIGLTTDGRSATRQQTFRATSPQDRWMALPGAVTASIRPTSGDVRRRPATPSGRTAITAPSSPDRGLLPWSRRARRGVESRPAIRHIKRQITSALTSGNKNGEMRCTYTHVRGMFRRSQAAPSPDDDVTPSRRSDPHIGVSTRIAYYPLWFPTASAIIVFLAEPVVRITPGLSARSVSNRPRLTARRSPALESPVVRGAFAMHCRYAEAGDWP